MIPLALQAARWDGSLATIYVVRVPGGGGLVLADVEYPSKPRPNVVLDPALRGDLKELSFAVP